LLDAHPRYGLHTALSPFQRGFHLNVSLLVATKLPDLSNSMTML